MYGAFAFMYILIWLVFLAVAVGITALFVFICRSICRSKGLPESYKWFGLLGVIGVIVTAVMSPPYYPPYPPYPPTYNQQYGQPVQPEQPPVQNTEDTVVCQVCGRENSSRSNFCASCGNKLR